ncbi:hypothetical protein FJ980_32865, partial [Mesorhizobium sp. B1-1-5]
MIRTASAGDHPPSALVRYDAAVRALAEAKSVDEVKDLRDKAEAMRAYARQAKNKDLEADAAEIRIRAERRLGELIAEMRDVTPIARPVPPKPPAPPSAQITGPAETIDPDTGEITIDAVAEGLDADTADVIDDGMVDDTTFFERLEDALAVVSDLATVEEVWTDFDPLARFDGKVNGEINQSIALAIRKNAEKRSGSAKCSSRARLS